MNRARGQSEHRADHVTWQLERSLWPRSPCCLVSEAEELTTHLNLVKRGELFLYFYSLEVWLILMGEGLRLISCSPAGVREDVLREHKLQRLMTNPAKALAGHHPMVEVFLVIRLDWRPSISQLAMTSDD